MDLLSALFLGTLLFIDVMSQEKEYSYRPLKIGDKLSVQDMSPVAEKLLAKMRNPGSGIGIVSNKKNSTALSRDLFSYFFHTSKNSTILEELDIAGLNALQALALSGVHTSQNPGVILPETDRNFYCFSFGTFQQGHLINKIHRTCQYMLLNKTVDAGDSDVREIVQPSEWAQYERTCHYWVYTCAEPSYVETCALYASCDEDDIENGIHEHQDKQQIPKLKEFRRNFGVTLVDEEVQRIVSFQHLKRRTRYLDIKEK